MEDRITPDHASRGRIDRRSGLLFLLACLALVSGALVYLFARPAGHVPLIPLALQSGMLMDLGFPGDVLPMLLHAFALTLLIALILRPRSAGGLAMIGAAWFAIEALFECGQHHAVAGFLDDVLPAAIMQAPLLDHLFRYFLYGTFDPLDIAAALAGAGVACVLFHLLLQRKRSSR